MSPQPLSTSCLLLNALTTHAQVIIYFTLWAPTSFLKLSPCLAPPCCPHLASSLASDRSSFTSIMAALSSAHALFYFLWEQIEVICCQLSKGVKVCTVKSFLSHSCLSTPWLLSPEANEHYQFLIHASADTLCINMHISTNPPPTPDTHTPSFSPQQWHHCIHIKTYLTFFTTIYLEGRSLSVHHKLLCPFVHLYGMLLYACTWFIFSSLSGGLSGLLLGALLLLQTMS